MTSTASANRSTVKVGDTEVEVFSGGSGPDLLYLHGSGGNFGWQAHHEELARTHKVYAPSIVGFNGTARPDWVYTINDATHFMQSVVQALGLGQYVLAGHSLGGWVAAEMAAMDHQQLRGLVLVDPVGIKPEKGEITEVFMVGESTRAKLRFYDASQVSNYEEHTREPTSEEAETIYYNTVMAYRLCWRPYMHNPSLPYYLNKVNTPGLIVWGKQDAIVPLECGELYQQALPNASLKVIDRCGHSPHVEKPNDFHAALGEFLSGLK